MAARPPPRIAVVGASTLIGEALIAELRERRFGYAALTALDDHLYLGRPPARGEDEQGEAGVPIGDVAGFDFSGVDLVFFCGRALQSERYAEAAARHAWVIDGSAVFRTRADVPLVAADVNPGALANFAARGLVALPGSASVALATVLAPLDALAGVARAEVATYQAVSGSGRAALDDLATQSAALLSGRQARTRDHARRFAFNVIPQVDALEGDGQSREERRLRQETGRILDRPSLAINATAVRVPVFYGHSLAVHALFERSVSAAAASDMLRRSNGVCVIDPESSIEYPTPATLAAAPDKVYVGRLRADLTRDRALNFWIVADNVRKCAAHNAVSVAQILVNSAR